MRPIASILPLSVCQGGAVTVHAQKPEDHLDGPSRPIGPSGVKPGHAELVNDRAKLIMHRLIARRLKREPGALTWVRARLDEVGDNPPAYVDEWREILKGDVDAVRRRLIERSPEMTRLRLSSPFLGVLPLSDPELRRRIHRKARLGLRGTIQE
jgi:hypothetical protein